MQNWKRQNNARMIICNGKRRQMTQSSSIIAPFFRFLQSNVEHGRKGRERISKDKQWEWMRKNDSKIRQNFNIIDKKVADKNAPLIYRISVPKERHTFVTHLATWFYNSRKVES